MVHWCYVYFRSISPLALAMPTFAIVGTCIALVYLSEAQGQTHYYIGNTMNNYTTEAQLDAQGLNHEEWLEASMIAQRQMFNTARAKGVAIMAWKDTDFHDEHHYIVMAQNHKLEFVTWSWANGGFHCGHYYNDNEMQAWSDYKERT